MSLAGSPISVTDETAILKGLKVLVIDDSKTIRRTAETLLAKEGCQYFQGFLCSEPIDVPALAQLVMRGA